MEWSVSLLISWRAIGPPIQSSSCSIAIGTCLSLLRCVAATLAKPCALAAARSIERAHRRVVGAPSFVKVHSSIKDPALLFGRPQAAITNQAAMVLMAERGCGTPVHVRHRERSAPSHALVEHGFTTDDERIRHAHHTSATRRYQRVAIDHKRFCTANRRPCENDARNYACTATGWHRYSTARP